MKKLFLLPILACLIFSVVKADDHFSTIEGHSFDVVVGWENSIITREVGQNVNVNLWKIGGRYKYQTPDEIYGRAVINYAQGERDKNLENFKPNYWNLEGFVGWTWAFGEEGLISPFIALAYNNYKLKTRKSPKIDARFYGFSVMLGVDIMYMFVSNFSVGILAMVGLPVSNHVKVNDLVASVDRKDKVKSNLYWKTTVPVRYHIDEWYFGVEFGYSHNPHKDKDDKTYSLVRNDFSLAATGGVTF